MLQALTAFSPHDLIHCIRLLQTRSFALHDGQKIHPLVKLSLSCTTADASSRDAGCWCMIVAKKHLSVCSTWRESHGWWKACWKALMYSPDAVASGGSVLHTRYWMMVKEDQFLDQTLSKSLARLTRQIKGFSDCSDCDEHTGLGHPNRLADQAARDSYCQSIFWCFGQIWWIIFGISLELKSTLCRSPARHAEKCRRSNSSFQLVQQNHQTATVPQHLKIAWSTSLLMVRPCVEGLQTLFWKISWSCDSYGVSLLSILSRNHQVNMTGQRCWINRCNLSS